MRAVLAAISLLLLAGCGDEAKPPAAQATAAPTTTSAQTDSGDEQGYLYELGADGLLGNYAGPELIALGHAFCDDRRAGLDPLAGGATPGDGTYRFDEVSVPVWALDTSWIDLEARSHLCPDVTAG